MRVLVLGVTGMLGSAVYERFQHDGVEVLGTARSEVYLPVTATSGLVELDVRDISSVLQVLCDFRPDVVVNCVGIIKQAPQVTDPALTVQVNGLFPHVLAAQCGDLGARLVHVSTDCVFSGRDGFYTEESIPDPVDLYGRSKLVGEPVAKGSLTLRTSIIGHERQTRRSLVDWFLSQEGVVQGYTKAIYSGLPVTELARVIAEFVVPRPDLSGLYHVSSSAISKYDLLGLIQSAYGWAGEIIPVDGIDCDRTLDGSRFTQATNYIAPSWAEMIETMRASRGGGAS